MSYERAKEKDPTLTPARFLRLQRRALEILAEENARAFPGTEAIPLAPGDKPPPGAVVRPAVRPPTQA